MNHRSTHVAAAPEVSVDDGGHESVIVYRWFHPSWLWWYPRLLVLIALDLGILVGVRYALQVVQSYGVLVPIAFFLGVPAFALHTSVLHDLFNRTRLRVSDGQLHVEVGPLKRSTTSVALARVSAWSLATNRQRETLVATLHNGGQAVLASGLTPEGARAITHELQARTDISPDPSTPMPPTRPLIRTALSSLLFVGVALYLAARLASPAIPDLVVQVDSLGDGGSATFELDEPARIQAWLRGRIQLEQSVNPAFFFLNRIENGFRLVGTVTSGEVTSTIDCDPLDIEFFVDQSIVSGSSTTVSWYGRIANCGVNLPAGSGQVDLRLRGPDGPDPYTFERAEVLLRR